MPEHTVYRKSAWVHVQNGKILTVRSAGNDIFFIPGGGPEGAESSRDALIREVMEELRVRLKRSTIRSLGVFTAPSFENPEHIPVRMTCFTAEYAGVLTPASEVAEMDWFGFKDRARVSSVDQAVFDFLRLRRTIS